MIEYEAPYADNLAYARRLEYRAKKIAACVTLTPEFLCDAKLEHAVEYINSNISMVFYKKIYSRDVGNWTFTYPATAWDHFKQEYFPEWMKDWSPVKYKTERVAVEELLDKNVTTPTLYMVRYD